MKFCIDCGTERIENAKFCHECGFKYNGEEEVTEEKDKKDLALVIPKKLKNLSGATDSLNQIGRLTSLTGDTTVLNVLEVCSNGQKAFKKALYAHFNNDKVKIAAALRQETGLKYVRPQSNTKNTKTSFLDVAEFIVDNSSPRRFAKTIISKMKE
jgi:uncharacterized membrane protein YvbJ